MKGIDGIKADYLQGMLKSFKMDENGNPLTEQDRKNKSWNDRFVESMKKANETRVHTKESDEAFFNQYDQVMEEVLQFELDETKMMNANWIVSNYEEIMRFVQIAKNHFELMKNVETNQRFAAYQEHLLEKFERVGAIGELGGIYDVILNNVGPEFKHSDDDDMIRQINVLLFHSDLSAEEVVNNLNFNECKNERNEIPQS